MTRLLIAGATGLVGALALEQALADARVSRVIALTRRPIAPRDGLDTVVVDFSNLPDDADYWAVDGVIAALGTTRTQTRSPAAYRVIDHDYPLAIARHARRGGAARLALVSTLGANPDARFAYPRTKGELERNLRTLGYPSLTFVRPSVLGGDREKRRIDERLAQRAVRMLAPVLPRRMRLSPAAAVAASLIEGAVAGTPGFHIRTNDDMI